MGASRQGKRATAYSRPAPTHSESASDGRQNAPIINVSESDGLFNVHADFSLMAEHAGVSEATVEFSRQGVMITRGPVQRYIPIPTDGEIDRATVTNADAIVRISVPTAGLGHRWRSIMW